jgi:hypothetical protein
MTLPDGRVLTLVDYCKPIKPLPATGRSCPATFDEAIAQAATRLDASMSWYSAKVWACSDGHSMYTPYGAGTTCHYDRATKQLLAIINGDDTPYPCEQSDTASYVYTVYGQWLTCAAGTAIPFGGSAIDAGAIDAIDASARP